jgi:gamma-glutamylputrescine oxidase
MQADSVSYWQSTTAALPLSTDLLPTVEVAVVGGGLLGAATCYWLARQGVQVALLERTALAAGATGRNGGMVRAGMAGLYADGIARLGHETAFAITTFTYDSQALLYQVIQEESIPCEARQTSMIRLALTEEHVRRLSQEVELLEADGFPAQWLDRENLEADIHTPLAAEILGGRCLPDQILLHPAKLVQGLVQAALRRGAQAYQAQVLKLSQEGNAILLETSRGSLQAGAVVIALNAWTGKLLPSFADVIVPVREQMLAYRPIEPIFTTGVTADMVAGEYWQQRPDGTIVIGGCGTVAPGEDIGVWESVPTSVVQEAIEQILPRLFPQLAGGLRVAQRWAGLLGYTSDTLPIVDRVPQMPNVFVAGGFSGHGMPYIARSGQLLAHAVVNGTLSPALKPFRLDRPTLRRWKDDGQDEVHI